MNITPDCDCCPANDVPVMEDVGILVSDAPFALDRATMDKVNASRTYTTSRYHEKIAHKRANIFEEFLKCIPAETTFEYVQRKFGV